MGKQRERLRKTMEERETIKKLLGLTTKFNDSNDESDSDGKKKKKSKKKKKKKDSSKSDGNFYHHL